MLFPSNPGEKIRETRQAAGLTQKELAQELGVGLRTIQTWELGEARPQPGKQEQLNAWILRVTVQDGRRKRKGKRS